MMSELCAVNDNYLYDDVYEECDCGSINFHLTEYGVVCAGCDDLRYYNF